MTRFGNPSNSLLSDFRCACRYSEMKVEMQIRVESDLWYTGQHSLLADFLAGEKIG